MATGSDDQAKSSSTIFTARRSYKRLLLGVSIFIGCVIFVPIAIWLPIVASVVDCHNEIPHVAVSSFSLLLTNSSSSSSWDLTVSVEASYTSAQALLFYGKEGPHPHQLLLLWNASLPPIYDWDGAILTFTSRQVRGEQPILSDNDDTREMLDKWCRLRAAVFQLRFSIWSNGCVYSAACGDITLGFHRLRDPDLGIGGEAGALWAGPFSGPPIECPTEVVGSKPLLVKLFG